MLMSSDGEDYCFADSDVFSLPLDSDVFSLPLDSDVFSLPPIHACRDPVDFSWWFLMSVAPLYTYDEYGVCQSNVSQVGAVVIVPALPD